MQQQQVQPAVINYREAVQPQYRGVVINFRVWAVLIALSTVSQLMLVGAIGLGLAELPPLQMVLMMLTGMIALAAAVGLWLGRKWGLWLFAAVLGLGYARMLIQALTQLLATGAVHRPPQLVGTLLIGLALLALFVRQRDQLA